MKDKNIFYEVDGEKYRISESESAEFEKDFPNAKVNMSVNGENYLIGINERDEFLNDFAGSSVLYTDFDKEKQGKEDDDKTTVFETIGKGLGAAGVGTAKLAVDLARITGGAIEAIGDKTLDEVLKDQNRPLANISNKLGDVQERLSREADPTAGQQGYLELLKEGKIGKLAQKALGSGLESLPMMVAAGTGWGALLYGAGMAAEQYVDETEDGSNVDPWKRAINAIGSSALELAVERIGGPLKNIGKAGKEISEEAAKEILEVAVKEGTENVAKRITKKLLKEGGEEGVEELATSAGTDALGQALDWIDGNSDYGLEAQWNQYKEQNPDASKSDFAKAKAEEYMDAFIGGAVSGMEISGTVEGANRGLRKLNGETGDIMKSARDYGASMDYGDMYDTDADVATAKADLAKLFTNKNGEQTVSNEFIDTLSAEDAYALSERDDFSRDQRRAFGQLAVAKATQDGLNQKLDENLEANIAATRERIEGVTENGTVTTGMLNGRVVYVKGGIAKNGSVSISEDGANGPVIVVDSVTGEETTANSSDITSASSVDSATLIGDIESSFRENELNNRNAARNTMSIKAKLSAIQSLEGKKVMIDLGNGLAEVNIQQILPQSGEVLIKGKKGDLGGQSNVKIGADVFYDAISRDDNGNPIVTDGDIEVEDEAPDIAQTEVAVEDDFRGEVATILINGVPVDVEVISQDNPSDTIVYEYTDENGNTKRGRTTIGVFKSAIQQTAETPAIPEEPVAETPVAEEPVPVEEAPAAEETPVEETPLNPESIDWDALFEQDPEAYFVELQNQFGEETLDILNEEIDAAQGELDALAKAKTKSQNERLENRKKKASLQKRIEILNGMVARLTPAQDVVVEAPVENTPVEEAPEAPANVIPEAPAEAPAEEPAVVQAEPQPTTPVAPNPVDNPIREAQKKEKSLATQLKRYDLTHELKQDLAFKAGKAVADFFATREEYEAYAENATDLGEYNEDFERGVDESFANRPQNTGNSPVNSVPLGTEPKGENNGEQGEEDGTSGNGPSVPDNSGRTTDGGTEGGDQTSPKVGKGKANKGKAGNKVADKYPARKGNATQKLLVDTFGFNKVEIPNSRKETLNTIYDFMMAMSKMLGISPKSIGQGGWLDVGSLRSNAQSSAEHSLLSKVVDQSVVKATLKYKYAKIKGLAHEWWHALDHALSYFETGKGKFTASEIPASRFTGRQETWYAVNQVIKAIKDSGHESRMFTLKFPRRYVDYLVEPTEMAARAFEEYMKAKFAAAGIVIDNAVDTDYIAQPTAEEMAVITPAFDNLFNVLQEKEGKTPGTSVLYRIEGEEITPTEMQQEVGKYVVKWITDAGYKVHTDVNELKEAIKRSEKEKTQFLRTDEGVVYGLVQNGEIYLDSALLNPNTPIHEYTHIWDMIIMEQNPQLWEEGKNLLKQLPLWNEIANSEQYKSLQGDENLIASEVHSRLVGDKGEAVFAKLYERSNGHINETGVESDLIIRIKNWIGQVMENIKSIILPYNRDKSISLQEFIAMPLNDLVFNARPRDRYEETHRLYWGEQPANALSNYATLSGINIDEFNGHAQQYYSELNSGIGYVVYYGEVYIFDIDSDGLARPIIKLPSYEQARRRVDVFNRRNPNGDNISIIRKEDRAEVSGNNNSSDGIRGAGENVPSVAERESERKGRLETGWQNNRPQDSVGGSSVDSDGLLFRNSSIESEMEAIKSEAIANGTFMKAPNGQPTKLTERQWLQVRTQNFINWFGDWINDPENASKVVDENGEPLVVYHGSPYGNIEEFNRKGHSVSGLREFGSYFGTNKKLAELYAYARQQAKGDIEKYELEKAKLDAIIYNNDTPARVVLDAFDELDKLEASQKPKVYEVFLNIRNPREFDAEKSNGWDGWHKLKHDVGYDIKSGVEAIEAIAGHNRAARMDQKYDGIIAKNMADVHHEENLDELMGDVFLVFDETPENIKSAIDNVGTFDAADDRIRYRKSDAQNAAVDFLAGEPRLRVIENAVNEEAAKLGVSVTYKTRSEMPEGHKNDKGYYNTKTGEIVICTENASSIADAIQTILHESVAHKGLRQLMGDKFNEFITRVYESLDADTKAKVDALAAEHYDGNTAIATEEYMASLAETEDFANNSLWDKIKSIFEDIINAILGRNDIKIGDNELRYILRASYNNMVNPRGMESMRVWAQDQMMREEYKINQASPEILSRTGIDPTEVSRESAKAVYDKMVADRWNEFQRQFQDAMQPVRIAIDAIQQETGNLPIEDYENFILTQNQASSRSRVEMDIFARNYYSPIVEQVNNVIDVILEARGYDKKNRKKRSEVYAEIRQYLIAKHGLERNEYYQSTKTRKLTAWEKTKETDAVQKEYNEKVNLINTDTTLTDAERELQLRDALDELNAAIDEINTREVPDLRDYSGLTALFGMDPKKFREAEAEAQQLVDKFEAEAGSVTEEMWKKINAATDKTLRHSYESGMISRQQYNDIKAMFKFYIPLRGFDETTAEDVYSYARFEGNRFNPAVQSAGGRTSLADDPLAIIMNMAESEIAQGNKNRAKQALYNFILNRPLTDSQGNQVQNSLMQIENVWYIKNTDSDGNEIYTIAVPDHESGETYEEFENRMQALAAEDKAYKSKKGKVDVGMRFQKQQNRDAHYVYLKVNGVDKAIYINGDPKAADAINGIYGKPKGELAEKMGTLNRFISSTFTNYSLEFTARNYFRDMFYSHINIDVKEKDPAYRKKFRQNWRHNNLGTMMRMLKAYRAGEFDGKPLNEDEAAFVEFMANGGQTGYTVINSVENHKAELERAIKNMQNGIEKGGIKDSTVFKYTLGSIELLNEASELVTRFAAFKTSRDMGRGVETSINDAKEITVNFNTKGAQDGKGLFGAIASYFGWSKFFFNASVQGVQNIKAMAEANKLKFCSTVGGVAAIGFLMPVFTAVIAEILGGDEDEYWNIPEYDRQNNFCIPLGNGKYAKIPLPIGFREVYAIGDMVAAMAWDKKFTRDFGQVGTDIANKIASVVLPINPLESAANGLSLWHTLLYTALPSSVQFAIQNAINIDWKGAPLQKEYTYNEDDPQWMKAFNSNPSWMVGLSKWCNEHIGSGDMKGWDWSPEKLDNTLSSVFGGVYNLVKKTGRSISMIWNEENRNLSNIPLSGVVLGSGIESDDRFMTDAYYDMNEYYDQRIGFIKRRAKTFGYSLEDVFEKKKGRHHPKMQEIYGNSEFEWMREWYFGNKDLDKVNDKIKKLKKEIEAKENPTQDKLNRLSRLMNEFEDERRDFVNDMLELD